MLELPKVKVRTERIAGDALRKKSRSHLSHLETSSDRLDSRAGPRSAPIDVSADVIERR
jgi:hypothetical protein